MSSVMIVENSEKPLWLVRKLLSTINYEVAFETTNGFEAVEKYPIVKPNVVITDLTLSKSSGLEVLKEIKKNHPESKVMVIVPSEGPHTDECMNCGADACISHPFKMREFITLITGVDKPTTTDSKVAPVILDE